MKALVVLLVCAVSWAAALPSEIELASADADPNFTALPDLVNATDRRSLVSTDGMLCSIENQNVLTCYTIANLASVEFDEDAECSTVGAITKCSRTLSEEPIQ